MAALEAGARRIGGERGTFCNPITTEAAADPWMVYRDGFYYFTATLEPEGGLWVWKSATMTGIDRGTKVKVWSAPLEGPRSRQIWAPELHFLRGRWYLYYTASDGIDANHRHYVLESVTEDPQGEYWDRGRVDPEFEAYAIDGSVLQTPEGALYFLYTTGSLHIAPMSDPVAVSGSGVTIARPSLDWEHGWLEAPQALVRDGRIFIVYSAGHSAKVDYRLGLLAHRGGSLLDPESWVKSPEPVFEPYSGPDGQVYTTGHGSFTRSPDDTEDWLIYHAKDSAEYGFHGRTARAQPFTWDRGGAPCFGRPIPTGVLMPLPSGEPLP
jgi:GH43 family beta-xylosidase